ncbi:MAG: DUF1553 domain-containing protein, partial [Planctomycetaceae bacterium]
NCHNHPLDRWTQDDFHGFAAIFAPIDRGRNVRFTGRGTVTNLRTGEPAVPRIPGLRYLSPSEDLRPAVADWLTTGPAPPLARNLTNRLWKHLFGRGLVATPDNFGALGERPSHPELLDWLATEFVRLGWSRKALIRLIISSETYRQSSRGRPELGERDPLNILL